MCTFDGCRIFHNLASGSLPFKRVSSLLFNPPNSVTRGHRTRSYLNTASVFALSCRNAVSWPRGRSCIPEPTLTLGQPSMAYYPWTLWTTHIYLTKYRLKVSLTQCPLDQLLKMLSPPNTGTSVMGGKLEQKETAVLPKCS